MRYENVFGRPILKRMMSLRTKPESRTTVMIVDDEDVVREYLRLLFDAPPYEVVGEACNGAAAVELARRVQPDIVLLDVQMPVMDGVEALPLIRAASPGSRIIFYTAERLELARSVGADIVIGKEASTARLMDAVLSLSGGGQAKDKA